MRAITALLPSLLLALFTGDFAEAGSAGGDADQRPNIVLIVIDDLNDYQGAFGGHPQAQTPNIDELARHSVRFVNAHSNVPVCQPSRNSLFTGVYPHDSEDYDWVPQHEHPVLQHNKTLMDLFRENGYLTLGTGKLMHGGETGAWDVWGNDPRHDYGPFPFDGKKATVTPNVPEPYRKIGPIDGGFGRLSEVRSEGEWGAPGWILGWDNQPMRYINDADRDLTPDERQAAWAVDRLAELAEKPEQPFFLGVGFVRPHTPMYAPDRFFDMYPLDTLELAPWQANDARDTHFADNWPADAKGFKYYRELLESYDGDRDVAIKHFLQAYLACVSFVDEQVGKVVSAIRENPELARNTIVILTADHGWQMGEKSYVFKNSPWEESTRVPLIISDPGSSEAGETVEQPVALIDIFPTVTEYAQLQGDHRKNDTGAPLGGFSLRPLVRDPEAHWEGPEGALSIVGVSGPFMQTWDAENQTYAYRTKRWRYIRYSNGDEELYDHSSDPHEWKNLASMKQYREVVEELRQGVSKIIDKSLGR